MKNFLKIIQAINLKAMKDTDKSKGWGCSKLFSYIWVKRMSEDFSQGDGASISSLHELLLLLETTPVIVVSYACLTI